MHFVLLHAAGKMIAMKNSMLNNRVDFVEYPSPLHFTVYILMKIEFLLLMRQTMAAHICPYLANLTMSKNFAEYFNIYYQMVQ